MSGDLLQDLQNSLGAEYLIERELGGGGMSRVFLANERRLDRRVVIKVLDAGIGPEFSGPRFEREIAFAASLQHPHIVPLLRAGRAGDLPYYTMPFVDGESLRDRLARGPLSTADAVGILRDVALALEFAHARGVAHRDIKPENILLAGRSAVVTDFGIAKALSAATVQLEGSGLTAMGTIIGTPGYMAPEQAAGGVADARSDVYAWGVIAYELLAGAHPFAEHTTLQAMLAAHIADDPKPIATRARQVPPALAALVERCLAKDPDHRPASGSALVDGLGRAMPSASAGPAAGRRRALASAAAAAVVVGGVFAWLFVRSQHQRWAREVALPEARQLMAADRALGAFQLLERAARYLPADTDIAHALAADSRVVSITTSPAGAQVAIQDYVTPAGAWRVLGNSPLVQARVPDGYFRWKVSAPGAGAYVTAPLTEPAMRFALDSAMAAPPGMVRVPAQTWGTFVAFVGWLGPYTLPAFYLDRLEVTNREYQAFVDAGGYENAKYWTEPFVRNGTTLSRDEAMALFRDRTGRPGPSTWEGGHYPQGQADYPVSGVSWYEAAAYAAYAGKSLPTFAQWYEAAPPEVGRYVVQTSNISQRAPAPVGSFNGLGPFGTLDMAGNVREWTLNPFDHDHRFILGGDWASLTYIYAEPESLSPFDRSPVNGIRCVKNVAPLPAAVTGPITRESRDFTTVHPASDAVFAAYRALYAYDRTPLNARSDGVVAQTQDWTKERVSYDAAYGGQRITAYLFLPKRVPPPYQTVVFFPSARVLDLTDSRQLGDTAFFDYVVQSGRAVIYPIYQETYERRVRHVMPGTVDDADVITQRSKDVDRTLDYLATRPDIDTTRLAYLGVSMGAAEGVIYATNAQARLRAAVLLDGGYFLNRPAPGTDQADFAPRLKIPVLMVNGRYDFSFPMDQAQDPLFRMLGTPAADKRHVVLETPHDVRADRPDLVREVLSWLDRYLGPVR
ncbi:MAG TPA: protein kinase [Gemmatimonadaceae bacterium]|nr:protein kinase [Gemmatimonadaceae bacterium]